MIGSQFSIDFDINQDLCAFIYTEINEADAVEGILK